MRLAVGAGSLRKRPAAHEIHQLHLHDRAADDEAQAVVFSGRIARLHAHSVGPARPGAERHGDAVVRRG